MKRETDNYFTQKAERHYAITLLDIIYGSSMAEIMEELSFFEEAEAYEVCEGIKRAINFSKTKTILEIKKELLSLLEDKKKQFMIT